MARFSPPFYTRTSNKLSAGNEGQASCPGQLEVPGDANGHRGVGEADKSVLLVS